MKRIYLTIEAVVTLPSHIPVLSHSGCIKVEHQHADQWVEPFLTYASFGDDGEVLVPGDWPEGMETTIQSVKIKGDIA
jgi:hypothetical protein